MREATFENNWKNWACKGSVVNRALSSVHGGRVTWNYIYSPFKRTSCLLPSILVTYCTSNLNECGLLYSSVLDTYPEISFRKRTEFFPQALSLIFKPLSFQTDVVDQLIVSHYQQFTQLGRKYEFVARAQFLLTPFQVTQKLKRVECPNSLSICVWGETLNLIRFNLKIWIADKKETEFNS